MLGTPNPELMNEWCDPFLCIHQRRWLANEEGPIVPRAENVSGAVMFADICGFSQIAVRYAVLSEEGVEKLSRALDGCFGWMTRKVATGGGDVIGFAGDAVLALWSTTSYPGLSDCVRLAAQTAIEIQTKVGEATGFDSGDLVLRIGIGAGDLSLMQLGGLQQNWSFLVYGEPVREAGRACQGAQAGQITVSSAAWNTLRSDAHGMPLASDTVRLISMRKGRAENPVLVTHDLTRTSIPPDKLVNCIPRIVRELFRSGQSRWIGEFRRITAMFVNLPDHPLQDLIDLHGAVEICQRGIAQFDGDFYQLLMDDKGLSAIGVFGFPLLAHEDDAGRCLRAAVRIHRDLAAIGYSSSIGIATGRAFCGSYGAEFRQQYSAVGPVMNLAARLMQRARGRILAEEATHTAAAAAGLQFDPDGLQLIRVANRGGRQHSSESAQILAGRGQEVAVLHQALRSLTAARRPVTIVIEGEPGIGKSALVRSFTDSIRHEAITVLEGNADAIASGIPYHAWRPIFQHLCPIRSDQAENPLAGETLKNFIGGTELEALGPLLSAVLPVRIPESELTKQMSGEVRAHNIVRLLTHILGNQARGTPLVLMLDDMQWSDSGSWEIAADVARANHPIMLIVVMRTATAEAHGAGRTFFSGNDVTHLRLRGLSREDTRLLVSSRLNGRRITERAVDFIHRSSGGNPFFAEQLALEIADAGLMSSSNPGTDGNANDESTFARLSVPLNIEGLIQARVDRLNTASQMILKLASVLGTTFDLRALKALHSPSSDSTPIEDALKDLVREDLIQTVATAGQAYQFRSSITQTVLYAALAFDSKRDLHGTAARWYESESKTDLDSVAAVLTHHWREAGSPGRACKYAAQAGEVAFRNFLNEEAVRHLSTALALGQRAAEINDTADGPLSSTRKAQWEISLGRACVNLSRNQEGQEHLELGLGALGHCLPTSTMRTGISLLGQLLRQIVIRFARNSKGAPPADSALIRDCAGAYEGLVEIRYLKNDSIGSLLCAFRSLNIAETAGPSPELARGYATLGALAGFIPLRHIAENYFRRALDAASEINNLAAVEWVLLARATYDIGAANLERAASSLRRGLSIADNLHDDRRSDDMRQLLACILYHTGEVEDSLSMLEIAQMSSIRRADNRLTGEVVRWRAYGLLALERYDELEQCVEELSQLRSTPNLSGEVFHLSDVFTLRAALLVRRGRPQEALQCIEEASTRLKKVQNTFHDVLMEHYVLADLLLKVLEKPQTGAESSLYASVLHSAKKACAALQRLTRVFPLGVALSNFVNGRLERILHRSDRAEFMFCAGLTEARRLGLRRVEALISEVLSARTQ
jgi:class 3 adenylate cyclase/tetratricopeptide (TPR) repeat protein